MAVGEYIEGLPFCVQSSYLEGMKMSDYVGHRQEKLNISGRLVKTWLRNGRAFVNCKTLVKYLDDYPTYFQPLSRCGMGKQKSRKAE